jgi:hypothetical protein
MVNLTGKSTRWTNCTNRRGTYTGTMPDGVIGQRYYRQRIYAAELGRFLTRHSSKSLTSSLYHKRPFALDWNGEADTKGQFAVTSKTSLAPGKYGNYCGFSQKGICERRPGVSGWFPKPPPYNNPIDALDAACLAHDCCLFGAREWVLEFCGLRTCNSGLCSAARAINCTSLYPGAEDKRYRCENMKNKIRDFFCPKTGIFGKLF